MGYSSSEFLIPIDKKLLIAFLKKTEALMAGSAFYGEGSTIFHGLCPIFNVTRNMSMVCSSATMTNLLELAKCHRVRGIKQLLEIGHVFPLEPWLFSYKRTSPSVSFLTYYLHETLTKIFHHSSRLAGDIRHNLLPGAPWKSRPVSFG